MYTEQRSAPLISVRKNPEVRQCNSNTHLQALGAENDALQGTRVRMEEDWGAELWPQAAGGAAPTCQACTCSHNV